MININKKIICHKNRKVSSMFYMKQAMLAKYNVYLQIICNACITLRSKDTKCCWYILLIYNCVNIKEIYNKII